MLGTPFSRRRKADGRARFTFGGDQPGSRETSNDPTPDVYRPSLQPDERRRGVEQMVGDGDYLAKIESFAVSNFLPDADRKRLEDEKEKFDQAMEHGPLDDAVAPLHEMEKSYLNAYGAKAAKPAQPDPFTTTDLPYLNQRQLITDMKQPEYGLFGGEADPKLHEAIGKKLRKSALQGQKRLEPIEPSARDGNAATARLRQEDYVDLLPGVIDPSRVDIAPEQFIDLLPSPYDPNLTPPKDAVQTLEFRPFGSGNPALAQALFGANPLSPDEHARLANDEITPAISGVQVAQADPTSRVDGAETTPLSPQTKTRADTPSSASAADNEDVAANDRTTAGYSMLWMAPQEDFFAYAARAAETLKNKIEAAPANKRPTRLIKQNLLQSLGWVAISAESDEQFDGWVAKNGLDAPEYADAVDYARRYRKAPSAYLEASKTGRFADVDPRQLTASLSNLADTSQAFSHHQVFGLVDAAFLSFAQWSRVKGLEDAEQRAGLMRAAGANFGKSASEILKNLPTNAFVKTDHDEAALLIAAIQAPILSALPEAERDAFLDGARQVEDFALGQRVLGYVVHLLPAGRLSASGALRGAGRNKGSDPRLARERALEDAAFIDDVYEDLFDQSSIGAAAPLSKAEKLRLQRLRRDPAPKTAEDLMKLGGGRLPDKSLVGRDGIIYRENSEGLYVRSRDSDGYAHYATLDQVDTSGARLGRRVLTKLKGFEFERQFIEASGLKQNREIVPVSMRDGSTVWTVPDFWSIRKEHGGVIEVTRRQKLAKKMNQIRRQMDFADQEKAPYSLVVSPDVEIRRDHYEEITTPSDSGHPRHVYVFDPETGDFGEFVPPWKD